MVADTGRTFFAMLLTVLVWLWFASLPLHGMTIYVDAGNVGGPWNGLTPATAWQTIGEGVTHLATTNATLQGGHTVLVAPGTYAEQVDVTSDHAGLVGSVNALQASGRVVIDGEGVRAYCINIAGAAYFQHFVVDGFFCGRATSMGIYNARCSNLVLENCVVYDNAGNGMQTSVTCSIRNCIFAVNGGAGFTLHANADIEVFENTIVVGNSVYGVREDYSYSDICIVHCCFRGNGMGNVLDEGSASLRTAEEINNASPEDPGLTNYGNIVSNPGFSDLTNNWNFAEFYTNSPCLGAGKDGGNIGPFSDPALAPTSCLTYYVSSSTGSDLKDGLSSTSAWATIGKASGNAIAGDTVIVFPGRYPEEVTLSTWGSGDLEVKYVAGGGVLIDGGGTRGNGLCLNRVMGVNVSGFECINTTNAGICFEKSSANTVEASDCYSNELYGASFVRSPYNLIEKCLVYTNTSHGVSLDTGSKENHFVSCAVYCNNLGFNMYRAHKTWIADCNIYANRNNGINAVEEAGKSLVESSTVWGNNGYGVYVSGNACGIYLKNSIFASNTFYGAYANDPNAISFVSSSNCCYSANVSGEFRYNRNFAVCNTAVDINANDRCSDNIVDDPEFRNTETRDLRLREFSPCIDAGTATSPLETDFYGNQRITGSAVDIGSYELPPAGSVLQFW